MPARNSPTPSPAPASAAPPVPYYLRPNAKQRQMNAVMAELVPELDSSYARTPMARNKWRQPDESIVEYHDQNENENEHGNHNHENENNEDETSTDNNNNNNNNNNKTSIPCYIPASRQEYESKGRRPDYIWMPRRGQDIPPGYYHLTTQQAWIEAYRRFCRAKRASRGGFLGQLCGSCCGGCCRGGGGGRRSNNNNDDDQNKRDSPSSSSSHYPNKEERQLQNEILNLLWNRVVAEEPDDVEAQRMKLLNLQSVGGQGKAFGRAAYLPTLTTVILLGYY